MVAALRVECQHYWAGVSHVMQPVEHGYLDWVCYCWETPGCVCTPIQSTTVCVLDRILCTVVLYSARTYLSNTPL